MTGKEIVEAWKTMELVKDLRRHGTGNGTTLGTHLGVCDIAADCIECLIAEVKRLNTLINLVIPNEDPCGTEDERT